jgi:hypothetical protein
MFQAGTEIGQNQLVLDDAPHDARHLVAVEFDDRVLPLIFVIFGDPRMQAGHAAGVGRPGATIMAATAGGKSEAVD